MKTVAELAAENFEAQERLRYMAQSNVPTDYDERKKSAIAYAEAQAKAMATQRALDDAIKSAK